MERASERTDLNTPTIDSSNEVGTSFLNDHTPSILIRRFGLSSQHPSKNIISDPKNGTQTQDTCCGTLVYDTLVVKIFRLLVFLDADFSGYKVIERVLQDRVSS